MGEQVRLTVRRCGVTIARIGVRRLHRHLPKPPPSALVAFEAVREDTRWPCGWVLVGRPTSRVLQERGFVEVTRCATDGTGNACSALYGAASRWARKNGTPVLTYTLLSEPGTSLRAAGWVEIGATEGGQWDVPSRRRALRSGEVALPKRRWAPVWCADTIRDSMREAA
jgi:hypothetical protein